MQQIKLFLIKILGYAKFNKLREFKIFIFLFPILIKNYLTDAFLYYKHSNVFKNNTINKIETALILNYHAIEKGLLHEPIRYRFAINRIKELILLHERLDSYDCSNRSQIEASYLALCTYYEKHEANKIDISDYFPDSLYKKFKLLAPDKLTSVVNQNFESYFENSDKDFYHFSNSRCSVRNFTGELISIDNINKVIELASNAPSVCNRQPVRIYYLDDKNTINQVFRIQEGLNGFDEKISQLLIVVADRNYFYSIGERNQMYIDGGIFLMNLLYALQYYRIAACPAHWGMDVDKDKKIRPLLNLKESEKIICLVPIGIPSNSFKTTLSLRRTSDEILVNVKNENRSN